MEIYNILINIEIKYKDRKQEIDRKNNNRKVEVWILL